MIIDIEYVEAHARCANCFALDHHEHYCTFRLRRPAPQVRREDMAETTRRRVHHQPQYSQREDTRSQERQLEEEATFPLQRVDESNHRRADKRSKDKGKKLDADQSDQPSPPEFDY